MKNDSPFQLRAVKDKSKEMAQIKKLRPQTIEARYDALLDEYNQLIKEAHQKTNKYQTLFDLNPVPAFVINLKGIVTEANISTMEITGFGLEEIIDRHFFQLPFIPEIKLRHFLRLFIGITRGNIQTLKNIQWIDKSGELHYSNIIIRLLHDAEGKLDGFMIVAAVINQEKNKEQLLINTKQSFEKLNEKTTANVELSQKAEDLLKKEVKLRTIELNMVNSKLKKELSLRKTSEKQLKQSILDLKNLNAYAQKVREDERVKIARLLHDDLSQLLTSLKMELTMHKEKEGTFKYSDSDSLDTLINLLDQSTNAVISIITKLRPAILDNMGLIPALEWLFPNFQKRTGIIIDLRIKGNYFPEKGEESISVYRVVEEVLNNIRFHSKASYVRVRLSSNYASFSISIKDNGIGITKEDISNPFSFGIMGMKERIRTLKGRITFKGIPGKGSTIYIKIPVK